jgi:nitrate reductase gamma subunit
VRSFAQFMVFAGVLLFLLAAYSQTGYLDKADQVADVLAMGTSVLVTVAGLVFLLVTRETRHTRGEAR